MLVLLAQLSTSLLLSPSLVTHHRPAGRLPIGSRTLATVACDSEATRDSAESVARGFVSSRDSEEARERKAEIADSITRRDEEVRIANLGGYPEAIVESQEYKVQFKTTAGVFNVTLDRALSPLGVDRFVELVKDGHFTDMLFYRVLPGFLVQFGIAGDPAQHAKWDYTLGPDGEKIWPCPPLADEPNRAQFRQGSRKGPISFAGAGENIVPLVHCHGSIRFESPRRRTHKLERSTHLLPCMVRLFCGCGSIHRLSPTPQPPRSHCGKSSYKKD
jgi:hypothetical protein